MKKYIFILCVSILLLTACKSNEIESTFDKAPAEALAVEFLNKLYTIEDNTDYEQAVANMSLDGQGEALTFGYDVLCSEDAMWEAVSFHFLFREVAFDKNFTMSLNTCEISETSSSMADGSLLNEFTTVAYSYEIELLLTYEDESTEVINVDGNMNVKYIEDQWKVYAFGENVYHELWRNHHKR